GVLATDALITEGGELAELSPDTVEKLKAILPPAASTHNPIDILGDAEPERYAKTLEIVAKDPNSDGLLAILTPQAMSDPTQTAEQLVKTLEAEKLKSKSVQSKPVLASWMGGAEVAPGEEILNRASIFTFPYPDTAAHVFNLMWRYSYNLRGIYETPLLPDNCGDEACDRVLAETIIRMARSAGRTILTEYESKQLLSAYGIPTVETKIAKTPEEAVELAEKIGYPVVLKLYSETITHKTDVGGVRLLLQDAIAVTGAYNGIKHSVAEKVGEEHFLGVTVQPMLKLEGYEIILGSSVDPQFGPVLLFGTGGQLVEVFKDRALALPPLNSTLARRMMEQTKIYTALKGVRGRDPVNIAALEQLLVQFSQLVVEQPWIKEIDINPLLASPQRLIALDARVVLHEPNISASELPKPAIRPYPTQYVASWQMKNGAEVTIRPIRPEDEPLSVKFHQTLSEETVYLRYAHLVKLSQRTAHERLSRLCFIDYDREMALVTEYVNPETGQAQIIGIGRLSKLHGTSEAEFSMLVSDRFQRQGLGTELLRRLVQIARDEKLDRITADILSNNMAMQRISEKLGFRLERIIGEPMVKAIFEL
ncbi:GNAT family N-acetyltransferase, partial [Planktothrix sp. FACHB-1355]